VQTVIVDIDGTLADLTHRLHHVRNGARDWDTFFSLAGDDTVIQPISDLVRRLFDKYRVILVSGRPEKIRDITTGWLAAEAIPFVELLMRPDGDYRPDHIVKSQILDYILGDGHDVAFVIDDRPSVVAMWRERGLTCLQCRDWDEEAATKPGLLTLAVGPTGAGKTTFLVQRGADYGIHHSHVVSSDQMRADLCGNPHDQSKNEQVFKALHAVAKERIRHGLPTVIDATNIKRKDRLACAELTKGQVRYIVIDRPMDEKLRDAGWRLAAPGLIERHSQTFGSQLPDILRGDGLPNVTVVDARS